VYCFYFYNRRIIAKNFNTKERGSMKKESLQNIFLALKLGQKKEFAEKWFVIKKGEMEWFCDPSKKKLKDHLQFWMNLGLGEKGWILDNFVKWALGENFGDSP
jgi:hypothetical protein